MIVDLFAGPGGWDEGLRRIGRSVDIGIEWDKAACDTARAAGHERLQADIAQLDPFTIGGTGVEGLIASPPCQGFSMAGKGKGREDSARLIASVGDFANGDPRDTLHATMSDDRSLLALEPLRWALDLEPEWTAWEQVPAVLPLWEACAQVLRADGYSVWTGLVQAEQYGVPQTRKRAILTATRNGVADRPTPTHSKYNQRNPQQLDGLPRWVSMAEALGWGLVNRPSYSIMAGGKVMADGSGGHGNSGAEWGGASVRNALREARDSGDPERWMVAAGRTGAGTPRHDTSPAPTITGKGTAYVLTDLGDYQPRPLPAWTHDRPSYTITGGGTGSGGAEPFGNGARQQMKKAGGAVRVTVQEAAILQSFPADYPWQGTKTAQYRQCGDAVPPVMAAHVLASIGVGELSQKAEVA